MLSFLRGERGDQRERQPLLPRHHQDTSLQTSIEDKLHSFQILKALSDGYMPSNEQLVGHLRHAIDVLRTVPAGTSSTGKEFIRSFREHLKQLVAFFENKNSADQIQDFLWYAAKARLSIDLDDLEQLTREIQPRGDIATGEFHRRKLCHGQV